MEIVSNAIVNSSGYVQKYTPGNIVPGGCLFAGTTDLQPAGTTLENLVTNTIAAGTFGFNKMAIEAIFRSIIVGNGNRKRHQISFAGTTVADMDTSVAESVALELRLTIMRESSSIVRCFAVATVSGAISSPNPSYTKITSIDVSANDYDLIYKIRNYTSATDSTLHFYGIYLRPAP